MQVTIQHSMINSNGIIAMENDVSLIDNTSSDATEKSKDADFDDIEKSVIL